MFNMNPQRGRHMEGEAHGGEEHGEHGGKPHVFIHSHSNGHTVHAFHHDGTHEAHEHGHDAESAADHARELLTGGHSQGAEPGEERPEDDGATY